MATSELRKVKEVNGWKVNHPHSGANIFYAVFTLISVAFPLAFLFIPLIANDPMLNGLDIFRFFIEFMQGLFKGNYHPDPSNMIISWVVANVKSDLSDAVYYMFVAISMCMIVFMAMSLLKFIIAIIHLAKGYLRNTGSIVGISIFEFVLTVLIDVCFLFFYFAVLSKTEEHLVIWFVFIPLSISLFLMLFFAIMNGVHFRDTILEKDLDLHDGEPTVEHISKVHEVKKTTYEQSSTLPPNLTSIGGHAFAENQNLVVANIPLEVKKLGPSAFANCLKLQVVSIPAGVTEIGFNCFFNCVELERINYGGTKEEWKKIRRGSNWLAKAKTTEVVCLDGTIVVNPYH